MKISCIDTKKGKIITIYFRVRVVVLNAIFNNISAISWRSVLLVEKIGIPGENHRPAASHWQTLSHKVVEYTSPWARFELTTSVAIGTDCICRCKSNYYTITTTTAPSFLFNVQDRSNLVKRNKMGEKLNEDLIGNSFSFWVTCHRRYNGYRTHFECGRSLVRAQVKSNQELYN